MAKSKKNTETKQFLAIVYTDGLVSAIHCSDYSNEDERISILSDHDDIEAAKDAAKIYADENNLNFKY